MNNNLLLLLLLINKNKGGEQKKQSNVVKVPNVTGLNIAEARKKIENNGLKPVVSSLANTDGDKDTVVFQEPMEGFADPSTEVKLTLSKGPKDTPAPESDCLRLSGEFKDIANNFLMFQKVIEERLNRLEARDKSVKSTVATTSETK